MKKIPPLQQSEDPCTCGNWFHRAGTCSNPDCKKQRSINNSFYEEPKGQWRRKPKGVGWDKKSHKVIYRP